MEYFKGWSTIVGCLWWNLMRFWSFKLGYSSPLDTIIQALPPNIPTGSVYITSQTPQLNLACVVCVSDTRLPSTDPQNNFPYYQLTALLLDLPKGYWSLVTRPGPKTLLSPSVGLAPAHPRPTMGN